MLTKTISLCLFLYLSFFLFLSLSFFLSLSLSLSLSLNKIYYSKLKFTIVNYNLLQYHSFFHSKSKFLSFFHGTIVFPQYHSVFHSTIVFSKVPQFFHSKSKFLSYKSVQNFNYFDIFPQFFPLSIKDSQHLVIYHVFFFVNRSSMVLSIVPQFCQQYHSFFPQYHSFPQ